MGLLEVERVEGGVGPAEQGACAPVGSRHAAVVEAGEGFGDRPGALVVHLVGSFHSERGSGTPDALRFYRPGVRPLVVTIRPGAAWDAAQHAGLGDFVVLTQAP